MLKAADQFTFCESMLLQRQLEFSAPFKFPEFRSGQVHYSAEVEDHEGH
jgi:hypothetical protein